jgi:hypothetical protein
LGAAPADDGESDAKTSRHKELHVDSDFGVAFLVAVLLNAFFAASLEALPLPLEVVSAGAWSSSASSATPPTGVVKSG